MAALESSGDRPLHLQELRKGCLDEIYQESELLAAGYALPGWIEMYWVPDATTMVTAYLAGDYDSIGGDLLNTFVDQMKGSTSFEATRVFILWLRIVRIRIPPGAT